MTDHNKSTDKKSGAEGQGHSQPDNQVSGRMEGQVTGRGNTEERSKEQDQPTSDIITDMSSQNIDNTGVSAANEGTTLTATASSEASSSSSADEEERRGRGRERSPEPPVERVPRGGITNAPLQRVAGRERQKRRSKSRSRDRREKASKDTSEGGTSKRRSKSRLGPPESTSGGASSNEGAKQGSFNVIPLATNTKSTGTPSGTSEVPKRVDKGKQRAIEPNPSAENLPARSKSLESLDLQSSRQSNLASFFSTLVGRPSNAGPSNSGPSNAGPSGAGPSNTGSSGAGPSHPSHSTSLTRRHSSASTTTGVSPRNYLQEARKLLLLRMTDPEHLKRSRINLKNYPFSKEAAEAYSKVEVTKRLLQQARALLKERDEECEREKSKLSKLWKNAEQNVEQLQMALENEIEEKDGILAESDRRRKNVTDAGAQTEISNPNPRTEANVVSGILAKYKDRLAAAHPCTSGERSMGAGRQVDWSRLAPKSWGATGPRMRSFLHAHAENSDSSGSGNQHVDYHENVPATPRLPLFTFEMHEEHENACEEEEERLKTRKRENESK